MDHLTERQMQDHVRGTLAPDEALSFRAHLEGCGDCRQRLAAFEALWGQLGTWAVPAVPSDFDARVVAGLPTQEKARKRLAWRGSLRVAAALVLAAGMGHALGRLTWKPLPPPPAGDANAAAAALHLDDGATAETLLAALEMPEEARP